ncbi:MAG: ABC transporter permease [Candidatus Hadarchaeum sp.]|uniref:ABC transporter permease n=1 Tax=Candidatus Hadarchaeum sp. TaxID=2883567 RepID=UPI00317C6075
MLFIISLISGILMPRFTKLLPSSLLLAMPVAYLALGESFALISGEVDLASGSVLILVNAVAASIYTDYNITGPLFVLIPIAVGIFTGITHGILISYGRLNSFLLTVGTSFMWSGLALVILREPRGSIPVWFSNIFASNFGGIPIALWALFLACGIWLAFYYSPLSLTFYAVGSATRTAYTLGIDVKRMKLYAFILNGFVAGLAGLIMTGIVGSGDPRLGATSTLVAILAALVGGASFSGGSGNGLGAIAAAIGLQFARNLVAWVGVTYYLLDLIYGAIIVILMALISFGRSKIAV